MNWFGRANQLGNPSPSVLNRVRVPYFGFE